MEEQSSHRVGRERKGIHRSLFMTALREKLNQDDFT